MNQPMAIIPRAQLTPEQLKVVEMPSDKHLFFIGPAGSGKTQILVHRALHLAIMHKLSSDRYRLFVLTDAAKHFLCADSGIFDLPSESVTTLDIWCENFYEKHISKDLPRIYINLKLDRQEIQKKVLQELQRRRQTESILDFAVVDDGQDLPPDSFPYHRLCGFQAKANGKRHIGVPHF
jgi:superfamily I DNA and RNA helicase